MATSIQAKLVKTLEGHRDAIYALAFNPSTGELLSAGGEGIVASWKPFESDDAHLLARTTSTIYYLCIGNQLLGFSCRDGSAHLVDIPSKKELLSTEATVLPAFSTKMNLNYLYVSQPYKLIKYDTQNSNAPPVVIEVPIETIRAIDFEANGLIWLAGSGGKVLAIDKSGKIQQHLSIENHDTVFSIACLSNDWVVTGSKDAHLRVWDANGNILQAIPAHNWPIYAIELSPNNRLLATSSRDKTVKIWEAETLELIKVLDKSKYPDAHSHSVNSVVWLDDRHLASAGDDRKICIWELDY